MINEIINDVVDTVLKHQDEIKLGMTAVLLSTVPIYNTLKYIYDNNITGKTYENPIYKSLDDNIV